MRAEEGAAAAVPSQPWPLIGRDDSLDVFRRALAGPGKRVFLISGPTGIGKSRLAEECYAIAVSEGYRCARAMTSQATRTTAFGATGHLLPAGLRRDHASLFESLANDLRRRRGRILLFVDDLQYLDDASAALLVRLLDTGSLFLLATLCSDQPAPAMLGAIGHVDKSRRADLARFDEAQVEQALNAALNGLVDRATVLRLHRLSAGVPLFLRELINGSIASGALRGDDGAWRLTGAVPHTGRLVEKIENRTRGMRRDDRNVLDTIALLSPLAVAGLDQHSLVRLESAGLVRLWAHEGRTLAEMAVPIHGEVIRARLPLLDRQQRLADHRRRLEASGPAQRDDLLQLVMCSLDGGHLVDQRALDEAADRARDIRAYSLLADISRAVIRLEPSAAAHVMLAEALYELGRFDQADAALLDARGAADVDVGRQDTRIALLQARLLTWAHFEPRQVQFLSAVRESAPDPGAQAVMAAHHANMLLFLGETNAALESTSQFAAGSGLEAVAANALPTSWALAESARTNQAHAMVREGLRARQSAPGSAALEHPAMFAIPQMLALVLEGRISEAIRVGEVSHTDAARGEAPVARMWTALYLGVAEYWAGHLPRALAWFTSAAVLAADHQADNCFWRAQSGLAVVHAVQGEGAASEDAWRKARHLVPDFQQHVEVLATIGWRHAADGHLSKARDLLAHAADQAHAAGSLATEARLLSDIARLGDPRRVADRLDKLAQSCDSTLINVLADNAGALADRDPHRLEDAASRLEESGADLCATESFSRAAELYRAVGDRVSAMGAAKRARRLSECCGRNHITVSAMIDVDEPLSPREREIALLASQGLTSKEIAAQLMLSVRTVDSHLLHVYRKTGVSRRRDLTKVLMSA